MTTIANDLQSCDVKGKTVLLRADLNVPVQGRRVTDDTRIKRILPTLRQLVSRGAKVVLLSHFGRPKGRRVADMSLIVVADALRELLAGTSVAFVDDCIGREVTQTLASMEHGSVLLCENLRFHAGEESGDDAFAKDIADLGDIYVNDAFACSHRSHASITGLPKYLPSYFGEAMRREVSVLEAVFAKPKSPVAALVGGSKVSTKMALLENLVERMDILMVGGGMANTFLYAQGHDVGASLCEPDLKDLALTVMQKAKEQSCKILLPIDVVVAKELASRAASRVVPIGSISADDMALDVGPYTVEAWSAAIRAANTLVWNGPVGAFETPPFDNASVALARMIAAETEAKRLISVGGGGDTVAALSHAGLTEAVTYVSTAGGAFLEWLEGKVLPGVAAIEAQQQERSAG